MKVEYTDVSDTQKSLLVEIPQEVVGSEIDRVIQSYARSLRLPGFRPGKIPAKIIRQRYKQQVLNDVAQDLIPRTVESALRERGVEPIDAPSVRDVQIDEGQPLTFTATFETAPPVDPGTYASLTVHKPPVTVSAEQVDQTVTRLREQAARFEAVTDRGAETGDTVVMNLTRRQVLKPEPAAEPLIVVTDAPAPASSSAASSSSGAETLGEPEKLDDVGVEIGAAANPPGFDEHLLGVTAGTEKTFRVSFPVDYGVESLAGSELEYAIQVTGLRHKVLPALDDEFAKDVGFDSLEHLRERVQANLQREGERHQDRHARQELLQQLAERVPFDAPEVLVGREVDRRVDEFVHQLIDQRVDPRQAQIDWDQFRAEQREPAVNTVKCMLVLDEIARREQLAVDDAEVEAEVARYAEASKQPAATVRDRLEKDGAISRIYAGLRREKAIDFAMARATLVEA